MKSLIEVPLASKSCLDPEIESKIRPYADVILKYQRQPGTPPGKCMHPFSCELLDLSITNEKACSYKSLKSKPHIEKMIEKLGHIKQHHPDFFKNLTLTIPSEKTPAKYKPQEALTSSSKSKSGESIKDKTYQTIISRLKKRKDLLTDSLAIALIDTIGQIKENKEYTRNQPYFHPLSCAFFDIPEKDRDKDCSYKALARRKFPETLTFKIEHFKNKHPEFYTKLKAAAEKSTARTSPLPDEEPSSKRTRILKNFHT